jgi:hypothetical protein
MRSYRRQQQQPEQLRPHRAPWRARESLPIFGYNLEVFVTMTNNSMDDTAGLAIADALHLGTLRYPGGTMSNIWDSRAGRYVEGCCSANGSHSYSKFQPYAELIKDAGPVGTFGAAKFLQGVGGRARTTIWDMNVFSFNTSEACAQIEYIASLPPPPDGVHLLELGNEVYSKGQGRPKFMTGASYAEQMKPIIACARKILPKAQIAAVGYSGPSSSAWSEGIAASGLGVDALSLHTYIPHDSEVAAVPEAERLGYVAGYSRQLLRHCLNVSVGTFGLEKKIWHTEFNYGLEKDIFLPELVFGALHGVFHASRILASVELHEHVKALTFQTFVHPHPYPTQDSAFHPAMPVARISPQPNRPDLAQVSGTAQLVSHLAFHAMRAGEMHPVRTSGGCPLASRELFKQPWPVEGTAAPAAPPCILASSFTEVNPHGSGDSWSAWAILNACVEAVPLSLVASVRAGEPIKAASKHEVTTYNISDPGGWAPLPAKPDVLPWTSGPLRPRH